MTSPLSLANDAVRYMVAKAISKGVTDLAAVKLAAAGRGLSSEVELTALAAKVADAAVPALMEGIWGAIERQTVAKARGAEAHVYIDAEGVADALVESLDMVVKADTVGIIFDGAPLMAVNLAKATGPAPTVHVDVHVPAARIQNDIHVPAQAAPTVHVHPVSVVRPPFEPTTTTVEYETGPDGKQRPKAIHRK